MARHEQLTVGKLTIESAIEDENGNTIVQDSTTQSQTDSNVASRTVSTHAVTASTVASAVTAGSTVSAAISAHGDAPQSLIMSETISVATSFDTDDAAYRSSIANNSTSIATNSTTQSTDDLAISYFNSATITDGTAASGVSAMVSAGADSYTTSMLSLIVSRVSVAANSNAM